MTTPTPDGNCAKLLHDIAVELKALEQARERYSPQLAPDFSIFDYVDTSELGLSRILGLVQSQRKTWPKRSVSALFYRKMPTEPR